MKYIWDEIKNDKNYTKHGVWFEEACTVFADINALELYDEAHSTHDEDRYILIGMSTLPRLLVVVYCEKIEGTIKIISARKAEPKERRVYEKRI